MSLNVVERRMRGPLTRAADERLVVFLNGDDPKMGSIIEVRSWASD